MANSTIEGSIQTYFDDWAEAFVSGDVERMVQQYSEDADVYLGGLPQMHGREQLRRFFGTLAKVADVDYEHRIDRVSYIEPQIAVVVGASWSISEMKENGEVVKSASRWMMVLHQKSDGKWETRHEVSQDTPDIKYEDRPSLTIAGN